MSTADSEHWPGRYKCEQILEVACPKCGARPHQWCDRTGEKLTRRGTEQRNAGTPPSHTERMWSRQGHEPHEFPGLLARQKPGRWDEPAPPRRPPRAVREAQCRPCARERAIRVALGSPLFPADFPCKHPAAQLPYSVQCV
jgi:hypothetical protein